MSEQMSIEPSVDPAAQTPTGVPGQQMPPSRPAPRRLYRSRDDRVLGGVCGGLAEYFDIDPVLVRIAAVALAVSGGVGVLAYIVAWIAVPERPLTGEPLAPDPDRLRATTNRRLGASIAFGVILIGTGVVMLLDRVAPWFNGAVFWPIVVIAVGAVFVTGAGRRRS